ncbi:MAG TPA: IS1595 family transposase [Rhizomicrobium sp.]|nr:IS1595 family transposase [Rhizomicrobium sp.]
MAQHFLLSSKAKTLRLADVLRMSVEEAETAFRKIRWHETAGEPVCPCCGALDPYLNPRPNGSTRYRCKACRGDFTVTSGTLFASHKRPLRDYLAAIAIFCNEVKGKSALALSRDLGLAYKSAFVLAHKLREAMAEELKARTVGGEGKVCEIDGGYFGGYVKPANRVENRKDRRLAINQSGKRQCVVIVRERDGKSLPAVFRSEGAALSWIKSRVAKGTVVNADEANAWNDLHSRFEMKRINHEQAYSADGACTNMAEEYFSRLRRAEIGHHHHIAGTYLLRYAQESSWREDNRRVANGDQTRTVASLAMRRGPSVDFSGYWQRHIKTV